MQLTMVIAACDVVLCIIKATKHRQIDDRSNVVSTLHCTHKLWRKVSYFALWVERAHRQQIAQKYSILFFLCMFFITVRVVCVKTRRSVVHITRWTFLIANVMYCNVFLCTSWHYRVSIDPIFFFWFFMHSVRIDFNFLKTFLF